MKGVRCKRITRCIGSVGLYVPGGTAVLPSTALMLAVVCSCLFKSFLTESIFVVPSSEISHVDYFLNSLHRLLDAKL
jgi:histidinol dehydrogenase